jgi:hypothetical protein
MSYNYLCNKHFQYLKILDLFVQNRILCNNHSTTKNHNKYTDPSNNHLTIKIDVSKKKFHRPPQLSTYYWKFWCLQNTMYRQCSKILVCYANSHQEQVKYGTTDTGPQRARRMASASIPNPSRSSTQTSLCFHPPCAPPVGHPKSIAPVRI